MADCINALKEWTDMASATIVYDSTVDEFTDNGLFTKVQGKPNIAVVGFTTDGDVFGGFYSVAVRERHKDVYDPDIFAFSFESHGRCETPERFMVKEELRENVYVYFSKDWNSDWGFVYFGVYDAGSFCLGNEKTDSFCETLSNVFEELEDTTLTGKNLASPDCDDENHHCTRLVAIQLE